VDGLQPNAAPGGPRTSVERRSYAPAVLHVALLGPLEVTRDGQVVRVPGGRSADLLVRLALDAGVVVRTDRLVDELWGEEAVDTRRNTLQSKVARLRRALGDPPVVSSGEGGYCLDVEPDDVDALVALRSSTDAAHLLTVGDDQGAADLAAATLKTFRGEVLQGVEGEWVDVHRVRLEAVRMQLVETRASALLRLGALGEVIGDLETEVAASPFQESLWELLITALYRAGRQADALAAYQRVRTELADQLGLEPGPQLQELEQQILVHDPSLIPLAARSHGAPLRPGNLPSLVIELVGRDADLTAVTDMLDTERLVDVVGAGGVGKTALAIAVGRQLSATDGVGSDGVWLARLETATTSDEVVDTLVAATGVSGGEAALLERLKVGAALVILDNCEHLLDAAARLALRLLDAAPELRVLCTSQVPLGIDGEVVVELAPLTMDDAVALFTRRADAHRRREGNVASSEDIAGLCESLDGLPLAIELAAARTKTLSIGEITRRLEDRFGVLSDPTSRGAERRRSLRSTIGWSYELLFPDDQRGLWALATFAGGAPLPAVESVLEALDVPVTAAIDVVSRLTSRSLVIVDDEGVADGVRYRLLDSIRAFALDAMHAAGQSERALAAHATWFVAAADGSTQRVRSSDQAEHLAFVRDERANIDAALSWAVTNDPPLALRLVNGFGWAWVVLGDSRGAQRLLTALDAIGEGAPPPDRASALLLAGWIEASTDRLELARTHIEAASDLANQIDDADLQARSAYYLAYVVSHGGHFDEALALTERADRLYEGMDRAWDRAANWLFAARAAISASDEHRSIAACDQVKHWLAQVHDPWLHVRGEAVYGELARMQLRFDDAVAHLGRAAGTSKELGFLQTEAYQTASLGRAQCQTGDYEAGAATLAAAVDKAEATGDVRLAALARVHLGRVLRALGDLDGARVALSAAADWHRAAGGGEQAALGDCLLAAMDAADQAPEAEERLRVILGGAQRDGSAHVEVFALDALARVAADAGDRNLAHHLCDQADQRMAATAHFITDRDRTDARWVRDGA
jgi:predicted ATPase/DNA-binding SARP family transcriptional activator